MNPHLQSRKVILESNKLISFSISRADDITQLISDLRSLTNSIDQFYYEESDEIKCQICNIHLKGVLRSHGDEILNQMFTTNYDLELFIERLITKCHPDPTSALEQRFDNLKQNAMSIQEYSRNFVVYCNRL